MIAKHHKAHIFLEHGLFTDIASFQELENRITALPQEERGNAFEVFAEAYFNTQALTKARNVWPASEIPESIRNELGLPSTDMGIDGVFQTHDDKYHAYQVKYRSHRTGLTWDELSTFMGLSDKSDKRVLFTNSDDISSVLNARTDFYSIKGNDLDRLDYSDFKAIENWLLSGDSIAREKKLPRPHQTEAINDIMQELAINDRSTAIMACGTGKTLVALWLAEKQDAQTILVLLPSLALVRQTLHDWAKENSWDTFNYLCVCSDSTVTSGVDETILHQQDLDFPVTTDQEIVSKFLQHPSISRKIIFSTYQSCQIIAAAMPEGFSFDLAIFDEAHKTASRDGANYAFALQDKNLSIKKRLFLTATPRHYNVHKKDKEGDQRLVFSMDDQSTYGRIAHNLSFCSAVKKDLICDYKIIISVVTSDMVNRDLLKKGEVVVNGDIIKAQRIANILAIKSAVDKYQVKRIFSFHNSVTSAKSFTAQTNEGIGAYLENFTTLHVNGEMSTSKRERLLKEFEQSNKAIISNARCLTEGVNVPAVDMVAFVSPKKSKVDIVQAAGRAMRKSTGKDFGYILIPLFVQIEENESLDDALIKTQFDTVWDVLQAMHEQDESLVEIISTMREEIGKALGFNDNRLKEKIEILGPELHLSELKKTITTTLIKKLGSSWDEKFGELIRFKEIYAHCNVPLRYPNSTKYHPLGMWLQSQRMRYKQNGLSDQCVEKLDKLGIVWDTYELAWEEKFTELCNFKEANGHCVVKMTVTCPLAIWVTNQRKLKKKNELRQDRFERLEAIGFDWNRFSSKWEKMYNALCRFKEINGHCDLPFDYTEVLGLVGWVGKQRSDFRKDILAQEHIEKLNSIGFVFTPFDSRWEEGFSELLKFKKIYGHCNVPICSKTYRNELLQKWVALQRKAYNNKRISETTQNRIDRLNEIGFFWVPFSSKWEEMYAELLKFKEANGHCMVPRSDQCKLLGRWVQRQRELYKNKERFNENKELKTANGKKLEIIKPDRMEKLERIGFVWDTLIDEWEQQFSALCAFQEKMGHCNIPQNYSENLTLVTWVSRQRQAKKKESLTQEQLLKLEKIGFDWNPINNYWEEMFNALNEYQIKHGHCNVPRHYFTNPKLGSWVHSQRNAYKKGSNFLSNERLGKLKAIRFDWNPQSTRWEEMFTILCKYSEKNGHCNVPCKDEKNPALASWVSTQRKVYKKGKMPKDRSDKLESVGFQWKN